MGSLYGKGNKRFDNGGHMKKVYKTPTLRTEKVEVAEIEGKR